MYKISQKVGFIILVVLIATIYMAQAATLQQVAKKSLAQHLLSKRDCSDLGGPCQRSRHCCDYPGSAYVGVAPRCDYADGICVLRQR